MNRESLVAEIERLTAKRATLEDLDLIQALEMKLASLREELAKLPEPTPEPVLEEEARELTPEESDRLEGMLRQVQVAKMRGHAQEVGQILSEAAQLAPAHPGVLEAFGDNLAERGQWREAQEIYKRAMKHTEGNIALERKHAESVLRATPSLTLEQQMSLQLGDPSNQIKDAGSIKSAAMLSFLLPGLGQILIGQTVRGGMILGGWLLCLIWIAIAKEQFLGFLAVVGIRPLTGGGPGSTGLIILPIFGALLLHLFAIFSIASLAKRLEGHKRVVERPRPPVDMPFE